MKTAKIVIGANFGDEGKGLMTDYFADKAGNGRRSCLVVCHNGGCQKGHTVAAPSGVRHVFHHFGSGNFAGADTYLAPQYIVNPMIFQREYCELAAKEALTKCYVDRKCRLTTPFDMMLNQIVEEHRGNEKHGSCGLGIFETIVRTGRTDGEFTICEFADKTDADRRMLLEEIAAVYLPDRLRELGVAGIPGQWVEILSSKDNIIDNYIADFRMMLEKVELTDDSIIDAYDEIIFEGAQGLLLDQNNISYMPHLTPSNTGIKNPLDIIGSREGDIEVCYVSRTYMTRHGAGRFDTECSKSDINADMVDLTNVPNPFQDTIRYGTLDLYDLRDRIEKDLGGRNLSKSIAFTHCNEYEADKSVIEMLFHDYNIYMSCGMTREDCCERSGR